MAKLIADRLEREAFEDPKLARFQESVSRAVQGAEGALQSTAGSLTDVSLSATAVEVEHGLGRAWTRYTVIKRSAGETVFDSVSGDDTRFIKLTATGAVVVDLEVD